MPTEVQIYQDRTIVAEDIADNSVTSEKIVNNSVTSAKLEVDSNGRGKRTVSLNPPSGGSDGDIWYVVDTPTVLDAAGISWLTSSTSTNRTLENREMCSVTADNITITLPASPASGWEVGINNTSTFKNIIIARNGKLLMGFSEDMTIDISYATVCLVYNSTVGWRISS
jgi:hypothetical protein